MRILLVHNRYQQPGGEDEVFRRERRVLLEHGHEVVEYTRDNKDIAAYGVRQKLGLPLRTLWAGDSYRELRELIKRRKPDVGHFHNTFPLVSPAGYYACAEENVPVVQSLHNPRLLCPAATLYRNGKLCESCARRTFAFPGIWHGCYQESRTRTAAVAAMVAMHRLLGTWTDKVSTYIASTEFVKQKFVNWGIPASKIIVKPHFVNSDPGCKQAAGDYVLFVGRLAPEKGVQTLLGAWRQTPAIPLHIRGEGPLAKQVAEFVAQSPADRVLLPRLGNDELRQVMKSAQFLVWPSLGEYETFGLVVIEAFACGVPVIASRSGVGHELVGDGRTGLHFTPGDAEDLARKVEWAWNHPDEMRRMGQNARAEYAAKYKANQHYQFMMDLYQTLCGHLDVTSLTSATCEQIVQS